MKNISFFLFLSISILTMSACQTMAQTKNSNLTAIEFNSSTRGTQKKVRIDAVDIHVSQRGMVRLDTVYEMKSSDWRAFKKLVNKVDLTKIDKLTAPSTKHQSDGALASSLTITMDKKTYTSSTFDGTNAPKELAPLMKKIIAKAKIK